jgi:hypothetical protein
MKLLESATREDAPLSTRIGGVLGRGDEGDRGWELDEIGCSFWGMGCYGGVPRSGLFSLDY